MRLYIYTIFLTLFGLLSGCASIVNERTQEIIITSSPDRAEVDIIDERGRSVYTGTTPAIVNLQRATGEYLGGKSYSVEIKKPGYKTQVVPVKSVANGWYVGGNFIFGGLIGYLLVDPVHGGMYTLEPEDAALTNTTKHNNKVDPKKFNGRDRISVVLLENYPGAATEAARQQELREIARKGNSEGLKQGEMSFEVEKLFKDRGCTADTGALLLSKGAGAEMYRVDCRNGARYFALCEYKQCRIVN